MAIFKYNVANPVTNNKLPFFDEKKGIFYVPINKTYKYFVETITPKENGEIEYHLLLSIVKFDINCRLCHTDNYGRVQIKVRGNFKEFIINELKERGNLNIEYIESIEDYEVFKIS